MSLLEAAKAVFVALHRTVPHPWEAPLVEASRALSAAIAAAEQGRTERRVPVQGERLYRREFPAGTVAWSEHLKAWQWYAKAGHGDQSAERVVERGGFGWTELCCLLGRTPQTWRAR